MNARPPTDLARHAVLTIRGVRHASTAPRSRPETIPPESYGKQIFVYNHLQKNHVVYSLTKSLNNNKALSQLPFNGKKTVPRALRKDLWTPLLTLTFPSGPTGLSVYQKLRELRRRHELEWRAETLFKGEAPEPKKTDKEKEQINRGLSPKQIGKKKKHDLMKKRAKALMDQRANSVADIAFVLRCLESPVEGNEALEKKAEEREKEGRGDKADLLKKWMKSKAAAERRERGEGSMGLVGEGTGVQVLAEWRNLLDAEYARKWSGNVSHGVLETTENNRRMRSRIQEIIVHEEPVEGEGEKEKIPA